MRTIICLFFAAAFTFTFSNAISQNSVVMKALSGTTKLNGGSTVAGHLGEIDVLSNSQGENNCATCNKPDISDFNFLMTLNPASIAFKKLLLTGTRLTSVDITFIKGGTTPLEYYKIHMEDVAVSSFQESASTDIPTISISLTPSRIAWLQNKTAGTSGKSSYGWDIVNNVEWIYAF